ALALAGTTVERVVGRVVMVMPGIAHRAGRRLERGKIIAFHRKQPPPMSDSGFSFSHDRLLEIATRGVDLARARGADACETEVSEGIGHTSSVRKSEVDTIDYNRD